MATFVRVYNKAKQEIGLLTELTDLSQQVTLNEPGILTGSLPYNANSASLLDWSSEYLAVVEDGDEQTEWYVLDDDSDDDADDNGLARPIKFVARGMMSLLERAVIYPDGHTPGAAVNKRNPVATFSKATPGHKMATLISRAKARGAIPELTMSFTATHDSAGTPWPTKTTQTFPAGADLLSTLQGFIEEGSVDASTSGWTLNLYVAKTALHRDLPNQVFRRGQNVLNAPRSRTRRGVKTVLLGVGSDKNMVEIVDPSGGINDFGRREGTFSDGRMTTYGSLTIQTTRALVEARRAKESLTLRLAAGPPPPGETWPRPMIDFRPGDCVSYDQRRIETTKFEALRVRAITFQWASETAAPTVTVEFIDLNVQWKVRHQQRMLALTNGAINNSAIPAGVLGPKVNVAQPKPPNLSQAGYSIVYALPTGGGHAAQVTQTWPQVTETVDDDEYTNHSTYEYQWRYYPDGGWSKVYSTSNLSELTITELNPGARIEIRVRTVANGPVPIYSDWAVATPTLLEVDTDPPVKPSAAVCTTRLGTATIVWDGKDHLGAAQVRDFSHVDVHFSVVAGFTPSSATVKGRLDPTRGSVGITVGNLAYQQTYYVVLVAYDRAGNASEPSSETAFTVKPLVDTDVIGKVLSGANFLDGTINTAALANGAVDASKIADLTSAPQVNGVSLETVLNAQQKADLAQAAAIAASLPKVDASGGATILRNPLKGYWTGTPPSVGDNIVIRTTLPATSGHMVKFTFTGSTMTFGSIAGWASVYLFNTAGGTLYLPKSSTSGELPVVARMAKDPSGNLVVILSAAAANGWDYLRFSLDEVQIGNGAVTEARRTGWTIACTDDVSEFSSTIVTCEARDLMDTHTLAQGWRKAGTVQMDGGKLYADSVTATQIAANTITVNELAANAVEADNIKAGAIIAGKIAADAVVANNIAANSVIAGKIAANAITTSTIAADAIVSTKIAAEAIGVRELAANSVVAGKIAANAITAGTIAALAINAGHLQSNAVTADKIEAGAIRADKIALGVLRANLIGDPSFEEGYDLTVFDPFGANTGVWQQGNPGQWRREAANLPTEAVERISGGARSGSKALALKSPGGAIGDASALSPSFPIEPGKNYRVTVHAHSREAQAVMVVACLVAATPTEMSNFGSLPLESDSDWVFPDLDTAPYDYTSYRPYSYLLSVPANDTRTWAALRITNYVPQEAATLVVDDVSVVEIGSGGASELTAAGLRLFDDAGVEAVALVSNRPTFLTGGGASIAVDGSASFTSVDASAFSVDGQPLVGLYGNSPVLDFQNEPLSTGRDLDTDPIGIIEQYAKGTVAWCQFPASAFAGNIISGQEKGLFELGFDMEPGRQYSFNMSPMLFNAGSAETIAMILRGTSDGSIPNLSSPILARDYQQGSPSGYGSAAINSRLVNGSDSTQTQLRVLVCVSAANGDISVYSSGSDSVLAHITDEGPSKNASGTVRNLLSSAPAPTVPAKRSYVKTFTANGSGTYQGDGSKRTNTTDVVQGYNSGNGNGKGLWTFPSMVPDLSGSTISKVEVYASAHHWWYSSGTARLQVHGSLSVPSSAPATTYITQSTGWPKKSTGAPRWVTLPNANITIGGTSSSLYAHLIAGRVRGFGMGPGPNNNLTYYGRFKGGSGSALMRVTYSK